VPVSPKKMRHQFIDLYGQEIYDKLLEQLKDEKNIEHLKTHGFNDLIDILNAIDEEEKCEC
jgi:Mg/Co/Ni transporter MgtE